VFDLLASLVDKSVVVAVEQPEPGAPTRYRMLETIREYAAERLDASGDRPAAEAAHTHLVLALAEEAEPHLRSAEQLEWLVRLTTEAEEIDLALRRAVAAQDADTGHRLVAAMAWSWMIRGLADESPRWVHAVELLDGPASAHARALTSAYSVMVHLGDDSKKFGPGGDPQRALELVAALDPPLHPVLRLFEPVRALFIDEDDGPLRELAADPAEPWLQATTIAVLATYAGNIGRIDEQRELTRRAHAIISALGDRFMLGMLLLNLGELEDIAGQHEAAASAYEEAVALATELGNDDDLPQFVARRAMLDARRGDLAAARSRLRRAEELGTDNPDQGGFLAVCRADIERLDGDLDAARAALGRLADLLPTDVDVSSTDGLSFGTAHRLSSLATARARVELDAGALDAARGLVAEAVGWSQSARDGASMAEAAQVAARLAFADGDPDRAARLLGVAAAQRGEPDVGDAEVQALDAAIRAALGDAAAHEAFRSARELPREAGVKLLAQTFPEPVPDRIS
jgi:tetratricopeptide (TPR) repeat protein